MRQFEGIFKDSAEIHLQYNFQSKYFKLDWQLGRDNFLSQFSFRIRKFFWGVTRNEGRKGMMSTFNEKRTDLCNYCTVTVNRSRRHVSDSWLIAHVTKQHISSLLFGQLQNITFDKAWRMWHTKESLLLTMQQRAKQCSRSQMLQEGLGDAK